MSDREYFYLPSEEDTSRRNRTKEQALRRKRTRPNDPVWAQEVLARVLTLTDRLPYVDETRRPELEARLREAMHLCYVAPRFFSWSRFVDYWYGSRVEQAWTYVHGVELAIIAYSNADLEPVLLEDAVSQAGALDLTDPARVRLTQYVEGQQRLGPQ